MASKPGKNPPGSLRIISGRIRGKRLHLPADSELRPTSERARAALFARLEAWWRQPDGRSRLLGAQVLDAFAGSGALGLEAWSRGAAAVTWFERNLAQAQHLTRTLAAYGTVIHADALRPPAGRPIDLLFLDPPYAEALHYSAVSALAQRGWLKPETLILCEAPAGQRPELAGFRLVNDFAIASSDFSFWQSL